MNEIYLRKNTRITLTAKKLLEIPTSVAILDKNLAEDLTIEPRALNSSPTSTGGLSKAGDSQKELSPAERMFKIRLPVLLAGESLQGEKMDPGSLSSVLYMYSAWPQSHWDELQTCVALK